MAHIRSSNGLPHLERLSGSFGPVDGRGLLFLLPDFRVLRTDVPGHPFFFPRPCFKRLSVAETIRGKEKVYGF